MADTGGFGISIKFSTMLDLKGAPKRVNKEIARVVKETTDDAFQKIKFATPRESGEAQAGWKQREEDDGRTGVMENKVDHINVLEFGPYPVTALSRSGVLRSGALIRGKAQLGGFRPGPRTQRAPGGKPTMRSNVSKQAPRGMVRRTLAELRPGFAIDMTEAVEIGLAGPGTVRTFESTERLIEF